MVREIHARFNKGVIEPLEELELEDGEEIIISIREITPETNGEDAFERSAGGWKNLIDTDTLLRDFKESRKIRAPDVEL